MSGTTVRELTADEIDRFRDALDALRGACDEYGFIFRRALDDERQVAVEPLLYGAGRVHVFRNAMLGKMSERIYDYADGFDAILASAMLTPSLEPEPAGWRRRYTDEDGWEKADERARG